MLGHTGVVDDVDTGRAKFSTDAVENLELLRKQLAEAAPDRVELLGRRLLAWIGRGGVRLRLLHES